MSARTLLLCDAMDHPCGPHRVQITRGLLQKYGPERVKDTPITEVGPWGAQPVTPDVGARPGHLHTASAIDASTMLRATVIATCRLDSRELQWVRRSLGCAQCASS